MMATLATGQYFLSNLRNLTIYDWCLRIDSFELLIEALVARRLSSHAQLQSFQGFFPDDSEANPTTALSRLCGSLLKMGCTFTFTGLAQQDKNIHEVMFLNGSDDKPFRA
jgi:hypothetical protein